MSNIFTVLLFFEVLLHRVPHNNKIIWAITLYFREEKKKNLQFTEMAPCVQSIQLSDSTDANITPDIPSRKALQEVKVTAALPAAGLVIDLVTQRLHAGGPVLQGRPPCIPNIGLHHSSWTMLTLHFILLSNNQPWTWTECLYYWKENLLNTKWCSLWKAE